MNDIYSTRDFYLAAFIMTLDFELINVTRDGARASFEFRKSKSLMSEIKAFYEKQSSVEPRKYGRTFRILKGILHNTNPSESNKSMDKLNGTNKSKRGSECKD